MSISGFLKIKNLSTSTAVVIDNNDLNAVGSSSITELQPLYFIDSNGNVNSTKFLSVTSSGRGSRAVYTVNVDSDCDFSLDHPFIFVFGEPEETEVNYEAFDEFLSGIPADSEAKSDANVVQEYIQQFIVTEPSGPAEFKQISGVVSVDQFVSESVDDKTVYSIICSTFGSSDGYALTDLTVDNELVVNSTDSNGSNKFIKYKLSNITSEGRGKNAIFTLSFDQIEGYTPNIGMGQNAMIVFSSKNNFIYLPVTSDGISSDDIIKARNQNLFDFDDFLAGKLDNVIKNVANVMFEIENVKSTNLKDYNTLLNYINNNIENLNNTLDSIQTKFNSLKDAFNNHVTKSNENINQWNENFENHRQALQTLANNQSTIVSKINEHSNEIEELQNKAKNSSSNLDELAGEVTLLNTNLSSTRLKTDLNSEQIKKLNSDLKSTNQNVTTNANEITSLKSTIRGINTTVSDQGTRISLLSKNVASNADDISMLNSKALSHDVDISNLYDEKLSGKEAQTLPDSSKENELYFIESTPSVVF